MVNFHALDLIKKSQNWEMWQVEPLMVIQICGILISSCIL